MRAPLIAALTAVALAGCDADSRASGPTPIGLNASLTEQTFTPLSLVFLNNCTGDIFLVTGTVHVVQTSTSAGAGGRHATLHVNFQSANGVSLTTGIQYQVISTQAISVNIASPLPFEQTVQVIVKLVGSGPEDNFSLQIQIHVTVNANGEVAVSFSDNQVVCH